MKQSILDHFGGDFTGFYSRYLPDLRHNKANCPFHDCDSRSLSVEPKEGLFNCHVPSCAASGDVFKFYALKNNLNGDFPAVLRGIAADFGINGPPEKKQLGPIVKTYDYTDASGKLIFQVVRYDNPKAFRQRRPDGNGDWIWSTKGVERVLYRLPEVLKASEVWIAEGEKDVDALRALGFTATCNPGGASEVADKKPDKKWLPSYTETLAGKQVFIIPDNDEAGRKHVENVGRSLHGKAASIKIIELPGLPKAGDVSDFIAGQPDPDTAAERLSIMADGAGEWTPPADPEPITETPSGFQFVHNADILADLRPIEWRIRDILTDYALYYNFGDPGHFKTFIELDRLLCIASGIDYHGHPVKQGTVFYIAGEGQQGIGRRIAAWHIAHKTQAADVHFFVAKVPTQLMDPAALDDVKRAVDAMAKEYGPPAVVHFDTLARNFGGGDENATKDMNAAIANLDKAFGTGFCRGLTHHTGHGNKDRARGSMALHGAADGAFRVSLTLSGQIAVECKKLKDAPTPPLMVFSRQEVALRIGDTEDHSYVLELAAEGQDAAVLCKPKAAAKLKAGLGKAVEILRNLHNHHQENVGKRGGRKSDALVSFEEWRTTCMAAGLYKRTDKFREACEKLVIRGFVGVDESKKFVHLIDIVDENE